jgi:hypothetical protein
MQARLACMSGVNVRSTRRFLQRKQQERLTGFMADPSLE